MRETPASAAGPAQGRTDYDAGTVVGHLVHELRQPLSTIESLAYYLKLVLGHPQSGLGHHLEQLRESVFEANWILSDAVHFLQIATPSPQLVDLNELVSAQIAELGAGRADWVELRLAPEAALVRLDVEQGGHLVRNLLIVFRRLSEPPPLVGLETRMAAGEVHLEVRTRLGRQLVDNLEAMFEPFSVHAPAGSGLALASARRIAEAHGGSVRFRAPEGSQLSLLAAFPKPA
jgi:signal transduction histidine kinase